jgi:hypothetical protein
MSLFLSLSLYILVAVSTHSSSLVASSALPALWGIFSLEAR